MDRYSAVYVVFHIWKALEKTRTTYCSESAAGVLLNLRGLLGHFDRFILCSLTMWNNNTIIPVNLAEYRLILAVSQAIFRASLQDNC